MSNDGFDYIVKISDEALDAMLLAATEACYFGVGRRTKGEPLVEIDGYLWGFHRDDFARKYTWIQVQRFAPSMSSTRSPDWVKPNEEAAELMHAVVTRRTPELAFVGEVHTHPYACLSDVLEVRGWEFSQGDRDNPSATVWHLCGERPPLWIVIATAPLDKVHRSEGVQRKENLLQFDVGNMRFWLHAEVAKRNDDGTVDFLKRPFIWSVPRFLNTSGDRVL